MTTSLRLVRHEDGTLSYLGELPDRHTFSSRYLENGGNAAAGEARGHMKVAEDKSRTKEEREAAKAAIKAAGNLDPLFTRDGADVIFPFRDGEVRYRFIGFESNDAGDLNYGAQIFERVT